MKDMRKLMQIVEGNEAETDKQKLDESVLGMVDVPSSLVGESAIGEEKSRAEYEDHITKKSYAPFNPMGDVQMEDEEVDLDDEDEEVVEKCNEEIQVVHEEEFVDSDDEDEDDEDEVVEEGVVDPEILEWMSRLDKLDGK